MEDGYSSIVGLILAFSPFSPHLIILQNKIIKLTTSRNKDVQKQIFSNKHYSLYNQEIFRLFLININNVAQK